MQRVFIKGIKGGTGGTSIVANLACALKKSDVDVIAIDLDAKSDLSLHFGLPWTQTLGWSNAETFNDALSMFQQDSNGIIFLPFGDNSATTDDVIDTVNSCQQLDLAPDTWMLYDCPSHIDITHYSLNHDDIFVELVNCDATCHSLIHKRLLALKKSKNNWKHYFLVNKYNSASLLEFDLFALWQTTLPLIAPFFINHDEVVKEATAYRNVAFNYAPYSVANDDIETLAGWLVSKAAL